MSDDQRRGDPSPKQGYIPRPPTQADLDLVSGQQGMIEDEWSGAPAEPEAKPEAEDPAKQPG